MTSSEQRSIEVEEKNKEKRESKQAAVSAINSGSVDLGQLVESASKENKSLGRKTVREIRRAQSTGRISNWLAQETLKFQSQQEASRAVGYSDSSSGFRSINQPQSFSLDPNPQSDKYISSYLDRDPTTTGGDSCEGLQIKKEGDTFIVTEGSVANETIGPTTVNEGYVYVKVTIDDEGEVTDRSIGSESSLPKNTDTAFYYALGKIEDGKITNWGCGNVTATICRNWYNADPPYYGVTLQRGTTSEA